MPLDKIEEAGDLIAQNTHPDANIIFGSVFDENMGDEMLITVIATGFSELSSGIPAHAGTADQSIIGSNSPFTQTNNTASAAGSDFLRAFNEAYNKNSQANNAAPAADAFHAPEKNNAASIFEDNDGDDGEVLPVFKGRNNIFGR